MLSRIRPGQRRLARGFTLMELLVAMSIAVLIMTATFGAVRTGNRSFEAARAQIEQSDGYRATERFLRQVLSQALPVTLDIDNETFNGFSGDANQLRFVAPAPEASRSAGILVYFLYFESSGDDQRLALSYQPYDPGASAFPARDITEGNVRLTSLRPSRFTYFGAPTENTDPGWLHDWPASSKQLPRAIALDIESDVNGDAQPPLVFIVRSEGSP